MNLEKRKKEKNIKSYFWIDWIQLLVIGLTAPFFLFPSRNHIWVYFMVPLILVCRRIVKKEFFKRTILDLTVGILLIQVFTTCLIVPDPDFSRPKIFGVVFGIFLFYSIVSLLTSSKSIKCGIVAFLGSGLILSVFSIIDMNWYPVIYFNKIIPKLAENIPKINWKLPGAEYGINPNALAGILIFILPLCLLLFFSHLKGKKEIYLVSNKLLQLIFLSVILFVMGIVLFLTQSKISWIGLIVSIWILFLSWKSKKRTIILIFLLAVFLFSLTHINLSLIIDEAKKDILTRKPWWEVGIQTISNHPLLGIGLNRMRKVPGIDTTHVHNHLLNTTAELGIPGLIAYLSILMGTGYMYYQIWDKSNIRWMKISAQGLVCGQLAHFIFGIGDSISLGAKPGVLFWISLGLIASIYNLTIEESYGTGSDKKYVESHN